MTSREKQRRVEQEDIHCYLEYLYEQERAPQTIQKYEYDLKELSIFLKEETVSKSGMIRWKEQLTQKYAVSSVNTKIAAANGFLEFRGWTDCKVKPLKMQREMFCSEDKELSKVEYMRLVNAAKQEGNERLSLLIQTICATGIRVSELRFITADAVRQGKAEVRNKGKHRTVFLPNKLQRILQKYLKKQKIIGGAVFVTRSGKPLNRSNIWRDMKALCESARVEPGKVFPHNLRHLFARTYYSMEKDLSRLADILGHSSVATTRIYTMESGVVHARQMEKMGLIVT